MNTQATTDRVDPALVRGNTFKAAEYRAEHFLWSVTDRVATLTLNRPERKNPITFDSYAEMGSISLLSIWPDCGVVCVAAT